MDHPETNSQTGRALKLLLPLFHFADTVVTGKGSACSIYFIYLFILYSHKEAITTCACQIYEQF